MSQPTITQNNRVTLAAVPMIVRRPQLVETITQTHLGFVCSNEIVVKT
jgi:hypothetical protein